MMIGLMQESAAPLGRALLPPPAVEEGQDVLPFLARRYSVGPRHLVHPAPSAAQLREAVAVALRAPDHHALRPFRFVRVADDQRDQLAGLFASDAARRGHVAAEVERARSRAYNGPALLAVVAHVRPMAGDVPPHEQWITVGAGVMNLLNALHMMGFGAKLLSGASVRDPAIGDAFCRSGETLVAWVVCGTPARVARAKHPDDVASAFEDWQPPRT